MQANGGQRPAEEPAQVREVAVAAGHQLGMAVGQQQGIGIRRQLGVWVASQAGHFSPDPLRGTLPAGGRRVVRRRLRGSGGSIGPAQVFPGEPAEFGFVVEAVGEASQLAAQVGDRGAGLGGLRAVFGLERLAGDQCHHRDAVLEGALHLPMTPGSQTVATVVDRGHPAAPPADDRQHRVGDGDLAVAAGHRVEPAPGCWIALDRLVAELTGSVGRQPAVGLELFGGRGDEDAHRLR